MRVLVVEDDPRMAAILRRGLEEETYALDVAVEGPEAVWLATEQDDAIVLDVMLPGIDEFEVCWRLRQVDRWAPVLPLTARDRVEHDVDGLAPDPARTAALDWVCRCGTALPRVWSFIFTGW